MGQYYKPYSIDKHEHIYTHDIKETYTREDKSTYESGQGLKLMEHSYISNPVMRAVENLLRGDWKGTRIVWAGDYADDEKGLSVNLYSIAGQDGRKPDTIVDAEQPRFIVNTSKAEFVDLDDVKVDADGFRIHPLPLLTCEGNGRGGGDYMGAETGYIGRWSRDCIEVADVEPKGFRKINPQFTEIRN